MQTLVTHARFFSHGEKGIINIGCGPLIHELILKPLIHEIISRDVDIQIHASTGRFEDLKHGLDNHSFDCLLYDVGELHTLHDPDAYEVIPLLQTPVYVVANHDHLIHPARDLDGDRDCLLYPRAKQVLRGDRRWGR
jgi:hypothetical protein